MLARESWLTEWADSLADWSCSEPSVTSTQPFGTKYLSESKKLAFDFTSDLAVGETISTAVVTCATYSGTDASPSSMISGAAAIATPQVTQLVVSGVESAIYLLSCAVTTSAGQTLKRTGLLAVIPEAL